MTAIKRILERSARLFFYLTLFNIAASIIMNLVFSGSISQQHVTSNLGDLALLEAMVFFLVGSAMDIAHSAKWSAAMILLKLRDKDWTIQESHDAERGALVHIIIGIFLVVELLLLALFMN